MLHVLWFTDADASTTDADTTQDTIQYDWSGSEASADVDHLPYLDRDDPNYDQRQDKDIYWCSAYTPEQATHARKAYYLQHGITDDKARKRGGNRWNQKHLPNYMHVEKVRQQDKKYYKKQCELTDQEQLDRVDTWRERSRDYRAIPNVEETRQHHRERLDRAATAAFARARLPRNN